MRTDEIKNEIDEIRKWEENIEPKELKYKTNKYLYDFQQLWGKYSQSFNKNIHQ